MVHRRLVLMAYGRRRVAKKHENKYEALDEHKACRVNDVELELGEFLTSGCAASSRKSPDLSATWDSGKIAAIQNLHGVNIVTGKGFQNLMKVAVGQQYRIPHRTTFSRYRIPKMYEACKLAVIQELKSIEFVCCTTQIWVDNFKDPAYMTLTAHILRNFEQKSYVFEIFHLPLHHTGMNIANCFAHNLNLTLAVDGFQNVPEIIALFEKGKTAVKHFREESEQRRKEMEHELRQVNDADKQYEDMETISEDEQEVIQEKIDEEIGKTYVTADLLLDDRDYDEIFNRNPQVHIESLKNMERVVVNTFVTMAAIDPIKVIQSNKAYRFLKDISRYSKSGYNELALEHISEALKV
ncbi:Uncharacterized protein APZ42_013888 [Daphnia magna]|uniref:Uncharacterized protein n=1 Tax=Daphnia magna TaxID=35525 RepID=A0A162QE55_9CRUS|nr:Uncharacterized protein APZ42_013888 [Daphnia magna]